MRHSKKPFDVFWRSLLEIEILSGEISAIEDGSWRRREVSEVDGLIDGMRWPWYNLEWDGRSGRRTLRSLSFLS